MTKNQYRVLLRSLLCLGIYITIMVSCFMLCIFGREGHGEGLATASVRTNFHPHPCNVLMWVRCHQTSVLCTSFLISGKVSPVSYTHLYITSKPFSSPSIEETSNAQPELSWEDQTKSVEKQRISGIKKVHIPICSLVN